MPKADKLLQTIEALHAAGLDETLWPSALRSLSHLFGAVGTTLEAIDKRSMRLTDFWAHGVPSGSELDYVDHFISISPRTALGFRPCTDPVAYDYMLLDEAAIDRNPYYSDFLGRAGLRYFVSAALTHTLDEFAAVAVQRSPRQGHVGEREIAVMRQLVPHLRQAFDVTRRLRSGAAAARSLERAFDWLTDGVALIARDGTVLYANEVLQDIARGKGIAIRKGMLVFDSPEARGRYAEAIGAILRLRDGHADKVVPQDFPAARSPATPPCLVSLRPLMRGARETDTRGQAVAIVFVRDPLRQDAANARLLVEMFGLTPTEAGLARAIQSGMSFDKYARERAVSLNTVYTHLRRLKEKTGCKRISELIRTLNDLHLPLRAD